MLAKSTPLRTGHSPGRAIALLVWLIPVTAALGVYLSVPGLPAGLYGFRWIALGLIGGAVLRHADRSDPGRLVALPLLALALVWLAWGVASLIWTPDLPAGVIELGAVGFGIAIAWSLIVTAGSNRRMLDTALAGWTAAFIVCALLAAWEVGTGHHLISSYTIAHPEFEGRRFASATFGNPNAYGAFAALTLPLHLLTYARAPSRLGRVVAVTLVALAFGVGIVTASRTALIAMFATVCAFLWCYLSGRSRAFGLLGVLGLGAGAISGAVLITGIGLPTLLDVASIAEGLASDESVVTRANMFRNGGRIVETTWGAGVGAGGFSEGIQFGVAMENTSGITNPHNFFLEVATEYGLVVLFALLLLLAWWAVLAWTRLRNARRNADREGIRMAACGIASLLAYVLAAGANSTFIPQPMNWVFLGTIGALLRVNERLVAPHPAERSS